MKSLALLVLIAIQLLPPAAAQHRPGAKQIALSNSDVALSDDVFAVFSNPAGLSQINWREIGLYYSPAPFGISEMANGHLAYLEPTEYGNFALGAMTYGFELYRETNIKFAYSYNYRNRFFGGISLNYHTFSISKYGSAGVIYLDAGGLSYLTDNLRTGFFIHNINSASLADAKDQVPTIFNLGISYSIEEFLSINFAVEKDIRFNPSVQFGLDYSIVENFSLRTGFSNQPSKYSAGIGINFSLFSLDYAFYSHQDLGITHQAGLIISFGKEKTRTKMIRDNLGLN